MESIQLECTDINFRSEKSYRNIITGWNLSSFLSHFAKEYGGKGTTIKIKSTSECYTKNICMKWMHNWYCRAHTIVNMNFIRLFRVEVGKELIIIIYTDATHWIERYGNVVDGNGICGWILLLHTYLQFFVWWSEFSQLCHVCSVAIFYQRI